LINQVGDRVGTNAIKAICADIAVRSTFCMRERGMFGDLKSVGRETKPSSLTAHERSLF